MPPAEPSSGRSSLRPSDPWLTVGVPLTPAVYARRPASELPYPLDQAGCALFARARHGIWHGVQALGLEEGDEILVPAYHSGAEVEALLRAGLACRFYDATGTLEPDPGELEALLGSRSRALYLIHYLGLPQDTIRWRRWCDERGLALIEDAAQAWLAEAGGRPVGSLADLAVFGLYKTLAVPDGAALVLRGGALQTGPRHAERGLLGAARRHAAWLGAQASPVARAGSLPLKARNISLRRQEQQREDVELGDPDSLPSSATSFLLPRLADRGIAEQRRCNYRRLLDELAGLVPDAFVRMPAGASPWVFPVEADELRELGKQVAREGVIAHDLWSAPHPALAASRFPGAARLYGRVLVLPVHQELRSADLERIVRAVRGASV